MGSRVAKPELRYAEAWRGLSLKMAPNPRKMAMAQQAMMPTTSRSRMEVRRRRTGRCPRTTDGGSFGEDGVV